MNEVVTVPSIMSLTALIFHFVSIWFAVRVTSKMGLSIMNWLTAGMMIGLIRRILDYAITFSYFEHYGYQGRYVELAYFPIAFSVCIILGFIQIYNAYRLSLVKGI